MDDAQRYSALEEKIRALVELAATTPADAEVPTCPGWTCSRLQSHLGNVYWFAAETVRTRAAEAPDVATRPADRPTDPAALPDWLRARGAGLVEALRNVPGDTPVYTLGADGSARFWLRRMLHETVVHHGDLWLVAEPDPPALHPELAVDGIDELLARAPELASRRRGGDPGAGEQLHVHATDAPGEWMVTLTPDGIVVTDGHGKGDVALRGPASDLLWALYRRVELPAAGIDVFGDDELLGRWLDAVRM